MCLTTHLVCPNTPCRTSSKADPPGSAHRIDIEERKLQRTWRIVIRHKCPVKCDTGSILKNVSILIGD
jgi:hypothetical protein